MIMNLVLLGLGGSILGGVLGAFLHVLVDDTRDSLWPRGLRWLPPAVDRLEDWVEYRARPECRFLFVPRRIRHLEDLDDQFRQAARLCGVWPEWFGKDDTHGRWYGYARRLDTCGCGYVTECGLWCGDGHETGACDGGHKGSPTWQG